MLTIIEGRVLGGLLEKERTVPDQYPLTMNALLSACNQSSSREPVMHLADHDVESAISSLKAAGLARLVHPSHGRSATRYRQVADEQWGLEPDAAALLAVLLLRGPQTVAELRTRSERLHEFGTAGDVERCLDQLAADGHVVLLDRQAGHKEPRWRQLVAEEAEPPASTPNRSPAASHGSVADRSADGMVDRITQLEARVAALEAALGDLLG